jgi:non-ribosomal peptide synthetase-like protein
VARVVPLLHEFFDRAAMRWPDDVAIEVPPGPGRPRRRLTYRDLDARASSLGVRLGPLPSTEPLVAILMARDSPWLVAAQLAALRGGAAFASLDPAFPDGQIRAQLDDAEPAAIVVDAASAARLRTLGLDRWPLVEVDAEAVPAVPNRVPPAPPSLTESSLAYVIYTSGTSGQPKGVLIEHRSIANLVQADLDEFGIGPGDRVVQGSSAAYDSSIEETWLALASGATLVVADDATVRLGPDLVTWLARERITAFCPPPTLLRATGCADPATALPHLRLLYVGGEALPLDVAERWGRGRTLVNGYGPTETTVTVVRETVQPGAPIAIGRPIAGVTASVLDADGVEAPPGEPGELCIGGAAVGRGYRGLPALTAERFPTHPTLGRIYRTGDRAIRDATGRIFYEGRLDAQVKVRGYRIELEAIEARLASSAGVAQAAVAVQGNGEAQRLVAFVVPSRPGAPPSPATLLAGLRDALPSYMVPVRLGVIDALPTTVGGKLDRASLPVLDVAPGGGQTRSPVVPSTPAEAAIVAAMAATLQRPGGVAATDDFFADLGGDSLGAGLLVSRLRERPDTAGLTTRDVYEARTAAALAQRAAAASAAPAPVTRQSVVLPPLGRVVAATAVQTAWLLGELAVASLVAYAVIAGLVPWLDAHVGLIGVVLTLPLVGALAAVLWAPVAVALTALAARLLTADLRPGTVPAWSAAHLRLWLVQRIAAHIPWGTLAGTHALTVTLRVLGARVGHRVHIHRGVDLQHGVWHLLSLGDDVSLARDVSVRVAELDAGHVVLGEIAIADGATLGVHAGVGPGARVGRGASLAPWTSVASDVRVPEGERWTGVPAQPAGPTPPAPTLDDDRALGAWTHVAAAAAARTVASATFALPALAAVIGGLMWLDIFTLAALRVRLWTAHLWTAAAVGSVASLVVSLVLSALGCRALGPERPGVFAARSWASIRVDAKTRLLDLASVWLSGAVFWPWWLRAAGMRIGAGAEVSTIIDTVPDLASIGDDCFLADGVYLAGPRFDRGTMTLGRVQVGARTFVGNHAVIAAGAGLPADALLGVSTVTTAAMSDAPGTAWFGHPPMTLPRPAATADRRTTHQPSWLRRVNRALWEAARLTLPIGLLAAAAWWAERLLDISARGVGLVVAASAATAMAGVALGGVSVALKWALLGRVRPGAHPLWSCWCSRWDFLYVVWGLYARWLAAPLEGTLWLPWYLRAMGMRIGRRVLLGPGFAQVVDPDMIEIGDGATVHAMFQAHTFEDRVLKIGRVRIGAGASVGPGTVPLYGVTIGEGTVVAPHSVVMKGETLAARTTYEGAPVAVRR